MDGQGLRMDGSGERNVRKLLERSRWLASIMAAAVAVVLIILVVFWRRIDAVDVKAAHRVDMIDLRIDGLMRRFDAGRLNPPPSINDKPPAAALTSSPGRKQEVTGVLEAVTPLDLTKGTAILLIPAPLNKTAVFGKR